MTKQNNNPKHSNILQTKQHYHNFKLKLNFKLNKHNKYNNDIYLQQPTKHKIKRPYQINIKQDTTDKPINLYLNN